MNVFPVLCSKNSADACRLRTNETASSCSGQSSIDEPEGFFGFDDDGSDTAGFAEVDKRFFLDLADCAIWFFHLEHEAEAEHDADYVSYAVLLERPSVHFEAPQVAAVFLLERFADAFLPARLSFLSHHF